MLEIKNGMGGYDESKIIDNINIQIEQGSKIALLGRNGAGKTTLLKYITHQLNLFSGEIFISGTKLDNNITKRARLGIGYVPQGRHVFSRLSVKENILAVAYANNNNATEIIDYVCEIFPILKDHLNRNANALSGGQQQIVAIARALAVNPKILLLDEPSEGIQPSIISDIADTLNQLNQQKNITLFIAEQNLDFCMSIATKAMILDKGTIVQEVSKKELNINKDLLTNLLAI